MNGRKPTWENSTTSDNRVVELLVVNSKASGCGPCRLCMGWSVQNPEPFARKNMNTPTPDTGSLPGTALETLGNPFDKDLGRDAIHLATVAVTSKERLYPGQHVGLVGDFKVSARAKETIGIVDPFLPASGVAPGQHFWLVLYPRTITGLRHVWTHPAFPEVAAKPIKPFKDTKASEDWLEAFCETVDCPGYETVMKIITEGSCNGTDEEGGGYIDEDAIHIGGSNASGDIPPEFWKHVEVVLGQPSRYKPTYFTCSC